MAETLALAVGVPAALGAVWLASRRSWSPAHADNRGIALQTVIVIVVMLVIAGGVAGVLLSRGSDVMDDLEAQDVTRAVDTAAECQRAANDLTGATTTGVFTPGTSCVVTSTTTAGGATGDRFTIADCQLAGGTHTGQEPGASAAGASVCTFTV